MLLQIHEPGQTPDPHYKQEPVVGIDLGTTYSLVSLVEEGIVTIIPNKNGDLSTESIVHYDEQGCSYVGDWHKQKEKTQNNPAYTIRSIKRLMGKSMDDVDVNITPYQLSANDEKNGLYLHIGGQKKSPVEISSEILKALKQQAEDYLDTQISKAVITVPAYFDEAARIATRQSARLAGLEVLRLINEPTAAAFAYGLEKNAEGLYAIYDLGGGTFDVSLLKLHKGVFQVLATGGNNRLGGDDFDLAIAHYIIEKETGQKLENLPFSTLNREAFIQACRSLKETLSSQDTASIDMDILEKKKTISLNIKELKSISHSMIEQTLSIMEDVMDEAAVPFSQLQGLVLVGGSTRMPIIRKAIEDFTHIKVLTDINPDQVVACGAAQQAYALSSGGDNLLLDVAPLSLGIELMGGVVEKIIDRNTPIPVSKSQEFTTYQDGQTGMMFHIVQGERELADQCRSLGQLHLQNIPPMISGMARIKVTFTLDADGLLSVSAQEKTTQLIQNVEIKPSYGLSEEAMTDMIKDSMENAKTDMTERLLREVRIEGKQIISKIEQALSKDSDLLSSSEIEILEKSIEALQKALDKSSYDDIRDQIEALNDLSTPFAQLRMDKHFQEALGGQNIKKIDTILKS